MKRIAVLILIVLFFGLVVFAHAQQKMKKMDTDPTKALAQSVENGKKLFNDKTLGTGGMACNSCHMDGGTKEGKMGEKSIPAFDNLAAKYPKFFTMANRVMTLDQVVNWCIMSPMQGKPLAWDDQKLTDLTAYCASVKPAKKEKE